MNRWRRFVAWLCWWRQRLLYKPAPPETAAEKVKRLRERLRADPSTGEYEVTPELREYQDAVIEEIIGHTERFQ